MASKRKKRSHAHGGGRSVAPACDARREGDLDEQGEAQAAPSAPAFLPSRVWRFGVWLVVGITLLCLDQIAKALVRAAVAGGFVRMTVAPGLIDFTFVANRGAAFGIGQGFGAVSVVLAVAVVAFSVAYLLRARWLSKVEIVGLALVFGGAVGNAIDRVLFGYVTDFIATTFVDFPVFNIADIGITVGVCLAFLGFALLSPANKHVHDGSRRTSGASGERRGRSGKGGER